MIICFSIFVLLFCIGKWIVILWKSGRKKTPQPDYTYIIFKDYSKSFAQMQHTTVEPSQAIGQKGLVEEDTIQDQASEKEKAPLQAILNFED